MPLPVRIRKTLAIVAVVAVTATLAVTLLATRAGTASAAVAPGSTVLVSVPNGTGVAGPTGENQEMSVDGSSVVFTSDAAMDGPVAPRLTNVYVRDLVRGRTVLISRGQFTRPVPDPGPGFGAPAMLNLSGAQPPPAVIPGETAANGNNVEPTISGDGRYVAFVSLADNIVEVDNDRRADIIVCDRDPDNDGDYDERRADDSGVDYRYFRVNTPRFSEGRTDFVSQPDFSDDGTRMVWHTFVFSDNLPQPVVVADLTVSAGGLGPPQATRTVPTPLPGLQVQSQNEPVLSGNGDHLAMQVVYYTFDSAGVRRQIFAIVAADLRPATPSVTRLDVDGFDEGGDPIFIGDTQDQVVESPAVSDDGSVVTFAAELYHMVDCGNDGRCYVPRFDQPNVYVVDRDESGAPLRSIIASRDTAGELVNGAEPALSGDGRFLGFVTDGFDVHDGVDHGRVNGNCMAEPTVDLTGSRPLHLAGLPPVDERRFDRTFCQVVVRDLVLDRQRLADELPRLPATLASPGRDRACAEELADDQTCAGDGNTIPQVYLTRVNRPSFTTDGERIAYDSVATDLVPEQGQDRPQVYVRIFQPALRIEPSPVEFGEVEQGQAASRTATASHVGAGPLVVTDVTVTGPNAAEFDLDAQTCLGQPLHQTGACEAGIEFRPAGSGDRAARLEIRVRGTNNPFVVDLHGTGRDVPVEPDDAAFAAGPNPVAFGQRVLRSAGPASTVTVTNTGGTAMKISAVTIVAPIEPGLPTPADDFAISQNSCLTTVAPGGQCTVAVTFAPIRKGPRTAVLRFVDDAPGGPHLVGLNGQGGEPVIEVNPGVVQPGRVTTVTGSGFPPGEQVTVRFTAGPGSTTAQIAADGTFRAALLVFPKASMESRTVLAIMTGPEFVPEISAVKPLLVVTPTVTPAEFVGRG